jgi:hypothetical protein
MSSKRSNHLSYSPANLEARPGLEPGIRVLQTLALPLGHLAPFCLSQSTQLQRMLRSLDDNWSGRRDLNPRPSPWQGDALPLSYFRSYGAAGQNRTGDTRIFSPLLYRLSYRGTS